MSKVLVEESSLQGVGNGIRYANGSNTTYKPAQFENAIKALKTTLGTKSITQNGTFAASSDNLDGFSSVDVNVPNSFAAADEGKVVSNGALVAQTARSSEITQNGTYDTTLNDEVVVNVSSGGGASFTRLTPLHEDLGGGYVSSNDGKWYVVPTATNLTDIYLLPVDIDYYVMLGASIGNRFRAAAFSTDPASATNTLSGGTVVNKQSTENPHAHQAAINYDNTALQDTKGIFGSRTNRYLAVTKTSNNQANISTYVFVPTF